MKMIDMGTAKVLKNSKYDRTFTIIGTPHYMAPEIISGKGYNYLVDIWSIGICLFEFVCGFVPFSDENDDPSVIYEEILNKQIIFPNYLKDINTQKIIMQLLNKNPELRIKGSFASLKTNPWFEDFDWVIIKYFEFLKN